jgi:predicted metal-dependent hydrolase
VPSKLEDTEFGPISIRRSRLTGSVRLRIDQRGKISISMPMRAPLFFAKQLLNGARDDIRRSLHKVVSARAVLQHGDIIGKTHKLNIAFGDDFKSRVVGTTLEVTLPNGSKQDSPENQTYIRSAILKALRTQAKAYLTRRLQQLAQDYGFGYERIRFTNAGTRWGSCSSSGTISLNIWLMQLPFELIDYVLIHELCHTKQMNHSPNFWNLVEAIIPNYKAHRRALKAQQPYA